MIPGKCINLRHKFLYLCRKMNRCLLVYLNDACYEIKLMLIISIIQKLNVIHLHQSECVCAIEITRIAHVDKMKT